MVRTTVRRVELQSADPAVHVMCGLVGAGKTTLATELATSLPAVRFSRDEWMIRLFALGYDDPEYATHLTSCTDLMWDVAASVLDVGVAVVLDWNHWSRQQRQGARARAAAAGYELIVHFLDVPLSTALSRVECRNVAGTPNTHRISADDVRHFATIFEEPDESELIGVVVHR